MTEPLHAARRRRERGAAAVLTIRPVGSGTHADARRRAAMAGHPAGSARPAPVLAFPAERAGVR